MSSFLVILLVIHVLGCLVYGGTGWFAYIILGRIERYIPIDKTPQERVRIIVAAEDGRAKMLPWIILATVAWEINVLCTLFSKVTK